MSRIFAIAGFTGVLLMSTATLRGGPAQESLRIGDLLPTLLTSLADRRPLTAGPDSLDRRVDR